MINILFLNPTGTEVSVKYPHSIKNKINFGINSCPK